MSLPKSFSLRTAHGKTIDIPAVGFGTWASGDNSWAEDSILTALKAGYRHLDCAWMYGVDGPVGNAIKRSGIPRSEIFITTKFWPHFGRPEDVELCLDKCLKGMGLDYVDLYLSHWPFVSKSLGREALEGAQSGPGATPEIKGQLMQDGKPVIDWEHTVQNMAALKGESGSFLPTWNAMKTCVLNGKARAVGVSNFSIPELKELLPHVNDVHLSCNQVEVHPWLPQNDMVKFCKENDIVLTCYSPFAGQKSDGATLLKDAEVNELAKKNGMDVGQLLQSWAVQRGTVPLGKSATPARIRSNLDVHKLSHEDMNKLNNLELPDGAGRTIDYTEAWGVPLFQN